MVKDETNNFKIVSKNRRATFDYEVTETFEAGIILVGSEVKSIRLGHISINESFAGEMGGEISPAIYLFNLTIEPYTQANQFNHEPRRPRKLLLRKRQITKMLTAIRRKGMTLVPLSIYFNHKGYIKVSLGLCRGKNTVDKRNTIKDRDWQRDKARLMRVKE